MNKGTGRCDEVQALVRNAQSGDVAAFKQLYALEVDRVYAVCLRMTGDRLQAERNTQDTFVKAWQNISGFRDESAFSTWLHRITVNVVLGEQRAKKRRQARIQHTDDLSFAGSAQPEAGSSLDLEQSIKALPARARQVLVLHDIEGYKHDEIARMMNIAAGTSKAHLHKARQLLRQMLTEKPPRTNQADKSQS